MVLELKILVLIVAMILIIILFARANSPKQDYGPAVQDCIDITKPTVDHNQLTQVKLQEMKFREKSKSTGQ